MNFGEKLVMIYVLVTVPLGIFMIIYLLLCPSQPKITWTTYKMKDPSTLNDHVQLGLRNDGVVVWKEIVKE